MSVVLTSADLTLRPWTADDAAALASLAGDEELRRWTSHRVDDLDDAERWIAAQEEGRRTGARLSFAIDVGGRAVGHIVLKRSAGPGGVAEVGYWTGAPARGRGVASRALEMLTVWAFDPGQGEGHTRLELIHNAGNPASCRVAEKAGYVLRAVLPPRSPQPLEGHLHARDRDAG
ncbi:GNAT family N-acetyltransferase [Streptomyces sp. t39]|uniref:GNAT family N-acetyltransferase n=1 Tax=Streptomyces sp. t39 TaxID=1828156 RepID=UPI0021CAE100|nr:GNAT family N-acetyltransferase [Streptomyces sp. t39]